MLRAGSRFPFGMALVVAVVAACLPALAHPMGNFSVNHYSGLKLSPDSLELRYIIDMAEIPTFQELQAAGITANPKDPRIKPYLSKKADDFWKGITLKIDGRPVELECREQQVIFPPGAGGLPTMKFGFTCRAPLKKLSAGAHRLEYRDDNFPGRAGWKEIIVNGDSELQLVSSAPHEDRSSELSNYPTDLLNSPPQDLQTSLSFTMPVAATAASSRPTAMRKLSTKSTMSTASIPARQEAPPQKNAAATAPQSRAPQLTANVQGTPRSAFTQLISNPQPSLWFLITAALIAMSLGALHALEPGHGKTLVAAYLVGSRGTARHAVALGFIVTMAHTAGVYALGAITLYASRYILPEKIYPWLGVVSGLVIAGLGLLLFLRRWVGEDSSLREDHRHWYDIFASPPQSPTLVDGPAAAVAVPAKQAISLKQLIILGITGGILPCPAALVVLLSAIALHRIAFGFFLIVAFSLGLASVLIGIGLTFVHAGRWLHRLNPQSALVRRHLPLLSAAFIFAVGAALTLQAVKSAGFLPHAGSLIASPKWLLIAGVGLILGMRHSTDPDHVIAVTTIVTRLRSLRSASLVGMIWGVGHTFTIFVVGSAIILFGIVIPPRVGLSMEFAVALMLILLGVLNLTGMLQWITDRFTPGGNRGLSAPLPTAEASSSKPSRAENAISGVFTRFGAYQLLRPLAIGIVHGLAGSAAVALLVLATIHNPVLAIGYLLLFGLGTILGMMIMTALIALPVVWTGKSFLRLNRYLCATSGIVSLAFGLFLVYEIGFVSGLFTATPNWIPS